MLSVRRLFRLKRKHGFDAILDYHDELEGNFTWMDHVPRVPVRTICGIVQRPLVPHEGTLTDLITGTQYDEYGLCLDSYQMQLLRCPRQFEAGKRVKRVVEEKSSNASRAEKKTFLTVPVSTEI